MYKPVLLLSIVTVITPFCTRFTSCALLSRLATRVGVSPQSSVLPLPVKRSLLDRKRVRNQSMYIDFHTRKTDSSLLLDVYGVEVPLVASRAELKSLVW